MVAIFNEPASPAPARRADEGADERPCDAVTGAAMTTDAVTADAATTQALLAALRARLGVAGQDLLDRFDSSHLRERLRAESARDIESRTATPQQQRAALALLERLVEERGSRLTIDAVIARVVRRAAADDATAPPTPRPRPRSH